MKYDAINSKVAGMNAKLLTYEDYSRLCKCKNVRDMSNRLRVHHASSYAGAVSDSDDIGLRLFSLLDEDYAKICKFISDNDIKKYLDSLFMKRQIFRAKYMLREAAYGDKGNIYALDKSQSFSRVYDCIEAFKGSAMYESLKSAYKPNIPLFELEIVLDLYYYTNLWRAKNKYLRGVNKDIAARISGTEIDMQNLIWIYRLKAYYKPAEQLMYKYIIPINYKISPELILQLVEADSEESLRALIKATPYGVFFADYIHIEDSLGKALSYAYRRTRGKKQNLIASIVWYLFRKEMEIKRIISIAEGVNYSLSPLEIIASVNYTVDKRYYGKEGSYA